jgi:hypothetical protein
MTSAKAALGLMMLVFGQGLNTSEATLGIGYRF